MNGSWNGTTCTLDQNYDLPTSDTLTIPEGVTLTLNLQLHIQGDLTNNGTINNNFDITSNGGDLTNNGTINNNGGFFTYPESITNNNGDLLNDGTINNNGDLLNDGTITNNGDLTNDNYFDNYRIINNNGDLLNDGTINNNGNINNRGTINNEDTINNNLNNNGNINNRAGTINNNGDMNHLGVFDGDLTIGYDNCVTSSGNGLAEFRELDDEIEMMEREEICQYTGVVYDITGSSITIPEYMTLIFNDSIITTDDNSDIYNFGRLHLTENTILTTNGGLNSAGDIMVNSGSRIVNNGAIDNGNAGKLDIGGNPADGNYGLTNSGTLTNHGYVVINTNGYVGGIHNMDTGIISTDSSGIIHIQNTAGESGIFNEGQLNNENEILIKNSARNGIYSTGEINNDAGVITVQGPNVSGAGLWIADTSSLNNSGEINLSCDGMGSGGYSFVSDISATVTGNSLNLLDSQDCYTLNGVATVNEDPTVNEEPQPPVQNNEGELTAQLCEEVAADDDRIQWTEPILPGYAGTCIMERWNDNDSPGDGVIIRPDVILLFRDATVVIAPETMMQVNGVLVLENTRFVNAGLLQVNDYLQIDEDSTFYHLENAQTISINGERFEGVTGAGELIIDPNASVLLEGELKNSGLIENAGTFDINMCSGSVDNIRAATITNVENGVVNEIACDEQANVADEQVNNNEIVCGEGTELFGGECRPIPQRQDPTVDVPNVPGPQVQQTETTIDLIATVTDSFENGVTTLDIKFNKNYVNYEIDVTQNGDRLFKETSHAMGTTVSYEIEGQGSTENPIDVKITSLGIGLPGQEDKWTGPTGLITTVQVVPEFGTIAMMILVVAIVSVVAITSKSRLMTKF